MELHKVGDICVVIEGPYHGLTCVVISELMHVTGTNMLTGEHFAGFRHQVAIEGVTAPAGIAHYAVWPGIVRKKPDRQETTQWENCVWQPTQMRSKIIEKFCYWQETDDRF